MVVGIPRLYLSYLLKSLKNIIFIYRNISNFKAEIKGVSLYLIIDDVLSKILRKIWLLIC